MPKTSKAAAPAANGGEAQTKPIAKKKKASPEKGYATYIHKVQKQLHPKGSGITVSSKAMELLNFIVEDLETRLTDKSFELAAFQKKSTLSAKHVQTATKLLFPLDMGGMAIGEGTKAVGKFFG